MKFSRQLDYYKIPEWSSFYIDYRTMKKLINRYLDYYLHTSPVKTPLVSPDDKLKIVLEEFQNQLNKINDFYIEKRDQLKIDLETVFICISRIRTVSTMGEKEAKKILSLEEKDDIQDRATSFKRSFTDVHRQVWWLEVFCEINYIALLKLCEKFNHCADFRKLIQKCDFVNWENELVPLRNEMYEYISEQNEKSSKYDAIQLLTSGSLYYRAAEIVKMSFALGVVVACGLVTIYMLIVNFKTINGDLYPSFPVFRFTLAINLVFISAAWIIY